MTAVLAILGKTWKIWAPALIVLTMGGTIWAQSMSLRATKAERDVAVQEHDRAMEEQRQLLADLDRLNSILKRKAQQQRALEVSLENSKQRIRNLAAARPDIADWRAMPIPAGLWSEVNRPSSGDPKRPDGAGPDTINGANQ